MSAPKLCEILVEREAKAHTGCVSASGKGKPNARKGRRTSAALSPSCCKKKLFA